MHLGFSYIGLVFLLLLMVPNLLWTNQQPAGYEDYVNHESKVLLAFERIGEAAVTVLVLIFRDFNLSPLSPWSLWLAGAFLLMALYEVWWVRYFRSEQTMADFYSSILGIPVAGATLPVAACLLLAVYGRNPLLFAAGIVLGIGHIGIHLGHRKELPKYELRFFFDFGPTASPLWCQNDVAYQRFGCGPIDMDVLGLPKNLQEILCKLWDEYQTSLDWADPGAPSPWSSDETERFRQRAWAAYQQVIAALGTQYSVEFAL